RRNEPTKMDPELFDLMWEMHQELGSQKPIHLISGYRSRRTNNSLRRRRGGQARNSRHILGKAADIHFPDVSVKQLRNSALVRERGGVGYYPTSSIPFVHVDTDRVRHWPRLPRQELAALFPSGKSKHVPRDGRPITRKDVRILVARQQRRAKDLARAAGTDRREKAPRVVLAGLTPGLPFGLGSKTGRSAGSQPSDAAANDITASIPRQPDAGYNLARVAGAPEFDPEHPDELSYQPFSVLPLMTDAPVAASTQLAGLVHPDQQKIGYLFQSSQRGVRLEFEAVPLHDRLLSARRFSGQAVRSLVFAKPPAGPDRPVPDRKPRRLLRTASR
ncbi:MAG: YcbK family protein, partial [Methyloligellaceae bacterium]